MRTKNSTSLMEICESTPVSSVYKTFTVEESWKSLPRLRNRRTRVYYTGEDFNNMLLFGIEGTGHLIRVPKEVYSTLGYPPADKDVSARRLRIEYNRYSRGH